MTGYPILAATTGVTTMWLIWSALTSLAKAKLLVGVVLALAAYGAWHVLRLAWWALAAPFRRARRPRPAATVLDTVLLRWTASDQLTLRDLLNGGILVLGRPGSGKTSSSFFQLLNAVVRGLSSGGIILAASPSDRRLVGKVFAGREARLLTFDERSGTTFNAISFILACGGSTKDVAQAIGAIFESVSRCGGQGGGDDGSFFTNAAKRLIYFAIVVVKHATGGASPADLIAFINSAAATPGDWHDEAFRASTHYRFMKAADEKAKPPVEAFDFDAAYGYFTGELPKMADRTRTSVVAVAMNYLHPFNTGLNRLLFSTTSNVTPALLDRGRWIFVDMPVGRCGEEGAFALGVWKFATEWYALRRDSDANNTPLFIAVDEFQNSINAYDSHYLAECRKFRSCMIACTQSKASFYANMGGEAAEAKVDTLLNNFTHKIFHALGDVTTAGWASQLVGSQMQISVGGSEQNNDDLLERATGLGGWGGSISEVMRPLMEPRDFMYGLRTGGEGNGMLCDAVLVRSGELFASTGQGFLKLAIPQG